MLSPDGISVEINEVSIAVINIIFISRVRERAPSAETWPDSTGDLAAARVKGVNKQRM